MLRSLALGVISFLIGTSSSASAQKIATTTVLTASANPAIVGQTITLTVTVTVASGPPPTAPVTFSLGGLFLQFGPLTNGVAHYAYQVTGPPNTLQFNATYGGDTTTLPSTAQPLNLIVAAAPGLAASATSISSSANPALPANT
jgi:hypothetical protein